MSYSALLLMLLLLVARISAYSTFTVRAGLSIGRSKVRMSSTLTSQYSHAEPLKSLPTLGAQSTLLKYLVPEDAEVVDGSRITPRQVTKAHYTKVLPEPVPHPTLLAYSQD